MIYGQLLASGKFRPFSFINNLFQNLIYLRPTCNVEKMWELHAEPIISIFIADIFHLQAEGFTFFP